MKSKLVLVIGMMAALMATGLVGCASGGDKVVEGDAEIVKQTPKNENPAAKTARDQAVQGSNAPNVMQPPPPEGN